MRTGILWTGAFGFKEGAMEEDIRYMRRAMELAERGRGWTNPNPVVGAVLVKEGNIIGEGFHERYGELHAERNALADCRKRGENPKDATIYVTLEPCCHYGKTPPCTEAIIEAGIKRVVVGAKDSNPLVGGKGIALLREHGIEVEEGVLEAECRKQNRVFFHYIENRAPYVVMKYAMTLDGKIATASGKSQWITGEKAREHVHNLRHELMGIMVGVGTVLADNPSLNCRLPGNLTEKKNPIRIICDSALRTPLESRVIQTAGEQKTILACLAQETEKKKPYEEAGCEIIELPEKDGHIDLQVLMKELGERGIDSILLEGGGTLNDSVLQSGIVHEVHAYIAPKLFGGAFAKTPVMGQGVDTPAEAFLLEDIQLEQIGEDILLIGTCKKR